MNKILSTLIASSVIISSTYGNEIIELTKVEVADMLYIIPENDNNNQIEELTSSILSLYNDTFKGIRLKIKRSGKKIGKNSKGPKGEISLKISFNYKY